MRSKSPRFVDARADASGGIEIKKPVNMPMAQLGDHEAPSDSARQQGRSPARVMPFREIGLMPLKAGEVAPR